jgi:selenide,water dikinase
MAERHLVLAGGGHAHVEVLRQFARRTLAGWRITLVTREVHSPYSGMLPGVAAGLYRAQQALIDTRALAARAGATLLVDSVDALDPDARLLRRAGGAPIAYDLLSLDTGATPDLSRVPGAARHALPLKPIDALLPRLAALVDAARPGQCLAVVGAGAAGTEMALRWRRGLEPGACGWCWSPAPPACCPACPRRSAGARRRRWPNAAWR